MGEAVSGSRTFVFLKRSFRRDAETNARDERAPQSILRQNEAYNLRKSSIVISPRMSASPTRIASTPHASRRATSSALFTRVPTDVIITPEGQIVSKTISSPTPAAYVAELTSAAGKYSMKSGQAYANAAAKAPMPSQINSAYANLQFAPDTQAVGPLAQAQQQLPAQSAFLRR